MGRVAPLTREELADREGLFGAYEQIVGFVPGTLFTLARVPGLLEAYVGLAHAAAMSGLVSEQLAQMVAHVASAADGCRYCQAHTVAHAAHLGVEPGKLADLWTFETSPRFDAAERAALRLALHAGQHPNAATDADFEDCRRYYRDDQITAIVAVCALFGFLNRWNDTMATPLEDGPHDVARRILAPQGWTADKHA
jgi:alkylhydroperoxidase family enzyme